MRDDVQKDDSTLELHSEMKAMYENLDTFDFYKWHQEKKKYFPRYLMWLTSVLSKSISYFMKILFTI